MDVLSQLVAATSIGRARSYVVECRAPWGRRFPSIRGVGVHVILQGQAVLVRSDGDPLPLAVGDVVLMPTGREHGMASGIDVPRTPMAKHAQGDAPTGPVIIGPDQESSSSVHVTRMVCGAYLHDVTRQHPLMRQLPQVVHLPAHLGQSSTLSRVVELLADELGGTRAGNQLAVEALLDLLFIATLRAWYDKNPDHGWALAFAEPAITEALHHVHQNPEHPWSVAELAARVGLSRATFAKRFTQLIGLPPLAYVTWWRMNLAAGLLRDTDRLLADIADAVGYTSAYAFANAFKRAHGVAPGRYRQGISA